MATINNIDELYRLIDGLKQIGIEPDGKLEKQLTELEQKIINDKILPIIANNLHPILKQIKRDLVLVVDYSPEEGVKVTLSRRRNMSGAVEDTNFVATPQNIEPAREHRCSTKPRQSSSGNRRGTTLRVTFEDGTIISENTAKQTMMECIKKIGPQRVANLCNTYPGSILKRNYVNLITKERSDRYSHRQHSIGDGWLVFDNTSTEDKRKQLEAISDGLDLNLIVEVIL